MSDEYLWNRSGSPDDETVRLERLLGQFRYGRRKPASRRFPQRWLLAAAAALLAGVAAIWALYPAPVTDWHFSNGGRLRVSAIGSRQPEAFRKGLNRQPSAKLRSIPIRGYG